MELHTAALQISAGLVQIAWVPGYLNIDTLVEEADDEGKTFYSRLPQTPDFLRDNFQKLITFVIEKLRSLK